jgi:Carboxypeptidase regulatory-like domain
MRAFVAVAAGLLLGACGAYQFPGSSPTPSTQGTVRGTVVSVPCAPVERVGSPCPGRPVGGLDISFVRDGSIVGRTVTDSAGRYSLQLAPGTYSVKFDTYMRLISGPASVTVAAGGTVVADYVLDNGIRLPVPQS